MTGLKFFRVEISGCQPHNCLDLSTAARVWSEDPEHRKVFEIVPETDAWKPIREFSPDELRETLRQQPVYFRAS